MSDSYQAVYNAACRKFGGFDASRLMDEIAAKFDVSYTIEVLKGELLNVVYEHLRPSVLYKPALSCDGSEWCALYGEDAKHGVTGFGGTPAEAMADFDKTWQEGKVK